MEGKLTPQNPPTKKKKKKKFRQADTEPNLLILLSECESSESLGS